MGFTGSDGDDLSTDVGERGLDENSEESEETTSRSGDALVLNERSRVVPVLESEVLAVGSSSSVDDDTEDDEAYR